MVRNCFKTLIFLFTIILHLDVTGQSNFDKAESYFNKRYENAEGLIAPSKNINKAIKFYKKDQTPESIAGLLRAYEFKGSYTKQAKMIRKKIYHRAARRGKKGLKNTLTKSALNTTTWPILGDGDKPSVF